LHSGSYWVRRFALLWSGDSAALACGCVQLTANKAVDDVGALLLGYYTDDGKLVYAGCVGTGMPDKVLADLRRRLEPLTRSTSPLCAPPPRKTRFGSPLVLSRVHWVEPQLVAEITYLTWTGDRLLRHTVYVGLRSDKPATQVRREVPRRG
jgi:ATP-dependent DNA ligase